jgi:hypothetical protein
LSMASSLRMRTDSIAPLIATTASDTALGCITN